jgi:hypothetical protein
MTLTILDPCTGTRSHHRGAQARTAPTAHVLGQAALNQLLASCGGGDHLDDCLLARRGLDGG